MKKKTGTIKRFAIASLVLSVMSTSAIMSVSQVAFADELELNSNMTYNEFINTIGPIAQEIANEKDIYASVMIAQAILESGWGTSGLSQAPNYNLFGIKGSYEGDSVLMSTSEQESDGTINNTVAGFRKYPSYYESLIDNASLISTDFYSGAWKTNAPTYADATKFLTGRYATSLDYNTKLDNLIETYNLTQYDVDTPVVLNAATGELDVKPNFETRMVDDKKDIVITTNESDSLWGVARENQVSIAQLREWNPKLNTESTDVLPVNTELKVNEEITQKEEAYQVITEITPIKYEVVLNDSVWKIATSHNLTIQQFKEMNPELSDDNIIYVGDQYKIGEETKTFEKILTDEEKALEIKKAEDAARLKYNDENSPGIEKISGDTQNPIIVENASELVTNILNEAQSYLGVPYVWGGTTPDGFDCSGLVQYVYGAYGVNLPRVTTGQEYAGAMIPVSEAKAGDLYFFGARGATHHVAIALGDGNFIHAPQQGDVVKITNVQYFAPDFAVRVIQ